MKKIFLLATAALLITACERKTADDITKETKGIAIPDTPTDSITTTPNGLPKTTTSIETEVTEVCATQHPNYRLVPIFKVNYNKRGERYVGYLSYITKYSYDDYYNGYTDNKGNNWHGNIVAGLKIGYGNNLVNVAVVNTETQQTKHFFEKPVFVENLYYPTPEKDTLNNKPITRNYYMISCYDTDTDGNGYLNRDDLRHFYLYNLEGERLQQLVPNGYGVIASDYDSVNDALYVYARQDTNANGKIELTEPKHIFLIDLKKPETAVLLYK